MTEPVPLDVRVLEIEWAVELGATGLKDITALMGIRLFELRQILADSEINYMELKIEKARKDIRYAIQLGAKNLKEIEDMTGLTHYTIKKYPAGDDTIKLPKRNYEHLQLPEKEERKRIKHIKRGLSLCAIADISGVTEENIRQFIVGRGLYDEWRESREHYKNKTSWKEKQREAGRGLSHALRTAINKKLEMAEPEERLALEKSIEYMSAKRYNIGKHSSLFLNNMFVLFTRYFKARSKGEKLSLEELSNGLFWSSRAGKILETVGLEPFYGKLERKTTPEEKKEAIKRAFNLEMSCADIGFFLDIPGYVVYGNMRMYFPNKKHQSVRQLERSGHKRMTYSDTSQIYEAMDRGISKRDEKVLIKKLNINQELFDYALNNKKIIEQEIKAALKVLYPDQKITKPYVDFEVVA